MQEIHEYPNGYRASVIDHGHGQEQGLREIAVLHEDHGLVYDTPVTDDVIGHLDDDGVARVLAEIEALPPRT